jgi:hypothetical protein
VSLGRAAERQNGDGTLQARWLEEQQEVRRLKAEEMRRQRLAREALAEQEAAERRLAAAAAAADKQTVLAQSLR